MTVELESLRLLKTLAKIDSNEEVSKEIDNNYEIIKNALETKTKKEEVCDIFINHGFSMIHIETIKGVDTYEEYTLMINEIFKDIFKNETCCSKEEFLKIKEVLK